ncbi:thiol:disulfide interchange protein [Dyadobacter beijingensis]|uniref:Thiol:disulfide interchange protein n=2 Tax=Dyadobacter beijingensis TaxID=365489 RepID=A0ABQ2I492_9BACT|nr:thiol:disulfide interchange protein [Dyadobacter beijingensis]
MLLSHVANAQNDAFVINGKLLYTRADKIHLYIADVITNTMRVDSTVVRDGIFTFKGHAPTPLKAILFSFPDNNRLDFFVEPGKMSVESKDSLHAAVVHAGKLNADYVALKAITDVIDADMRQYNKAMQAAVAASPEKAKDAEFQKKWNEKRESVTGQLAKANLDFAQSHPDNIAAVYAIANVSQQTDLAVVKPLFMGLSETVRNSPLGKTYGAKIAKLEGLNVGALAPEFTQADTAGRNVSLKDFRGKYVLVDFWASWCGPCRAENPNLIKAYERYKGKNFTVLGISLDRQAARTAWLNAIRKDGLPWTQLSDLKGWDNQVGKMYGVEAVPKNFLIDPDGRIVAKDLRGEMLNERLAEILGN